MKWDKEALIWLRFILTTEPAVFKEISHINNQLKKKPSKQMQTVDAKIVERCQSRGYTLLKKVGDGTYGTVFKANNLNAETVAIKLIKIECMHDQHLRSICREVYILHKLSQAK